MPELLALLADLQSGDDERAEQASARLPAHGQPAFDRLCQLRQSPHVDDRWWAVRALSQFPHSAELVDELVAALEDDSNEVRQCAALALTEHPDPQAVSPLIRLLSTSQPMLATLAANALIKTGKDSVPALIETVKNGQPAARLEAVRALAEIRDHRAIPVLMEIIQKDALVSNYWAEQGLNNLGLGMVYLQPE